MDHYKNEPRNVSDLIPYVNNSRTHSDEQVAQVAASIKEFGFTNPILIDEAGMIIAGHGRVMAAKKLGVESVPCIVLSGLSEAQKKAYIIADNNLALNAEWDLDILRLEIEHLAEIDFNLDLIGIGGDMLGDLFGTDREHSPPDDFQEIGESDLEHKCPKCGFEFNG